MKVFLTNGAELEPVAVMGNKKNVQGSMRDVLSFAFSADVGMENLDELFTPENCETITIRDDSGEYIHAAYTIRVELSKTPVVVEEETPSTPAVVEDRITVAMAQRTYMETQVANMQAAMNALLNAK